MLLAIYKHDCVIYYCRDANLWRSQFWRYFFGPAPWPTRPNLPMQLPPGKFRFWFGPPTHLPLPYRAVCQWLQLVLILIQSNSCLNRNNKETTLFFLFTTTCITQENEARNHYTSIRSQMILEFWNIWSLNLSYLWATDQNFLLSRSFGHPHGRAGDWLCIRETSG